MINIDLFRKNPDKFREMMVKRNMPVDKIDVLIDIDNRWKISTKQLDDLRAKQKELSSEKLIEEAKKNKELIKQLEFELGELEKTRYKVLIEIPNLPFDDVLVGKDENENRVIKKFGEPKEFDFEPKDHMELGEALGIIDTKKASEVSGSRFFYLKGKGAMLELALINFAVEQFTSNGFEFVIVPDMIKPEVYERMGRLNDSQKEERYYLEKDNLYLIGSAEHTIGPLHMDEILEEEFLPKRYVGFSTCFRREAGSYGKDTKGILRVHQFDKVEMYSFSLPEKSEEEHQFLISMQKKMFELLDIPHQIVEICTGDMGPTDARQFDTEAWIPTQKKYREVGSCSNTTDFQTRGINTKVRRKDGSSEYVHALNATALVIGRTMIAILENYQQADGTVLVPKALQKYLPFDIID